MQIYSRAVVFSVKEFISFHTIINDIVTRYNKNEKNKKAWVVFHGRYDEFPRPKKKKVRSGGEFPCRT